MSGTYTVDEKVRTNDWPDVLLERWSDEARRIPGWVEKPLACDFIAYAFAPAGTCLLLPVAALQRAWRQHGRHGSQSMGPGWRTTRTMSPLACRCPAAC